MEINGKFYIDGGVARNLPAGETRDRGADFVIGSSIYSVDSITNQKAKKMNRIEIAARALNFYERELSGYQEKQCDFCFKPQVAQFRWFDFLKMEEITRRGRDYSAKEIKNLLPLVNNL